MTTIPNQTQRNPLDELTNELSLLQKQRLKAIENCEFRKAHAIDCHIDRLKEEINDAKGKTEQIQTNLTFDIKKEAVKCEAIKALKETNDMIFNLKAEYQEKLFSLHAKHGETMAQLGDRYATEMELAATRENPETRYLINQAKFNAKSRRYGTAEALYQESNQNRAEFSAKRQNDVDDKFTRYKQIIETRQEREIRILKQKEASLILLSTENYKKFIAKLKRYLSKTATELGIVITPNDTNFLDAYIDQMESYESFDVSIDSQVLQNIKNGTTKNISAIDENSNTNSTKSSAKKKKKNRTPQTTSIYKYSNRSLDCDLNHSCNFSHFSTPRK
ncbi:hypothetical protein M9Y10_028594 [Tritrichomonas musculus]|uniref:Uncharacterized protein n=1 Tax=Tritrichomonas musculus TaxID=1915356 RepID=A0ABR2KJY2_9EUKA